MTEFTELDRLSVNTIRTLAIDGVQAANSGHPGLPLGAAPMAYVLWSRFLRFDSRDPAWPNRDRFILSAGHGSMLLYSLLTLTGYGLTIDDLKRFRQLGSRTAGHPERGLAPGIEVTTGPLGQGMGNSVGMAMAEAFLAATYNRDGHTLFDHHTYVLVSDGDLMEGITAEAASLAGHLKLGKLICLYDDNNISLDGPTNLAFTEDVLARFAAYGWHTLRVNDGNDLPAIESAILAAQADDRPSLIAVKTVIGYGAPKAGTSKVHGTPLGPDDVRATKVALGFDPNQSFVIPGQVDEHMRALGERGAALNAIWRDGLAAYTAAFPDLGAQVATAWADKLPAGWDAALPTYAPAGGEVATRDASGATIAALRKTIPWLIGGSADLSESTKTPGGHVSTFQPESYGVPVVWFGVREHAMGAALNGMAGHGGVKAYGGTFLTFSDYMRGSIRLAALSHHPVIYVFTHDSIGVGEDGPTHQPIEQVASLRTIPNLHVIRPGDANETVVAWKVALEETAHPTALILSRQKLPVFDQVSGPSADGLRRGAYVLRDSEKTPEIILIGTGSEVSLCLEAADEIAKHDVAVRVVSMPCQELFDAQDAAYRESVLPPTVKARLAIEAGVAQGWHRYTGDGGDVLALSSFGASAPYKEVYAHFGLTVEAAVARAMALIGRASAATGGDGVDGVPGSASGAEGHS